MKWMEAPSQFNHLLYPAGMKRMEAPSQFNRALAAAHVGVSA